MSLFIVFNISLNPAVFMLNKEPSK
jgi:hypothetical protein